MSRKVRSCLLISLLSVSLGIATLPVAAEEFFDGEAGMEIFVDDLPQLSATDENETSKEITIEGVRYWKKPDGTGYYAGVTGTNVEVKDNIGGIPVTQLCYISKNTETMKLPNSITTVGTEYEQIMLRGTKLKKLILPDSVTNIEPGYFAYGCKELTYVETGDGIMWIKGQDFADCPKLSKVKIGKSVTRIDAGAFQNCRKLKDIYIPSTVTNISPYAFDGIEKIVTIVGDKGSYAEGYAKNMGIAFKSTGKKVSQKQVYPKSIKVSGNTITAQIASDSIRMDDYEFRLLKKSVFYDEDWDINTVRDDGWGYLVKHQKYGSTARIPYVPKGTYYLQCQGSKWDTVKNEYAYTDWSIPVKVTVGAATPETPVIKSVKVNGNTVTVTVAGKAAGYDCVLGTGTKNNGLYYLGESQVFEKKLAKYSYIEKNKKTTTITFKNVKKGTYNLQLHSYNLYNNHKVFSKWSKIKTVNVN